MTEHCKGYVDAMMRLRPPMWASDDYNRGYREGFVSRLAAVKYAVNRLTEEQS